MEVGSKGTVLEMFGGIKIEVEVPLEVNDELTGLPLDHKQVIEGMKSEVKHSRLNKARKISSTCSTHLLQRSPTLTLFKKYIKRTIHLSGKYPSKGGSTDTALQFM